MLITCYECSNKISDEAEICPNCGFPKSEIHAEQRQLIFPEYELPAHLLSKRYFGIPPYTLGIEVVNGIVEDQQETSESVQINTVENTPTLALGEIKTYSMEGQPFTAGPSLRVATERNVRARTIVNVTQKIGLKTKERYLQLTFLNWNLGVRTGDQVVCLLLFGKNPTYVPFALLNVSRKNYYEFIDQTMPVSVIGLGCGGAFGAAVLAVFSGILGYHYGSTEWAQLLSMLAVCLVSGLMLLCLKNQMNSRRYMREAFASATQELLASPREEKTL